MLKADETRLPFTQIFCAVKEFNNPGTGEVDDDFYIEFQLISSLSTFCSIKPKYIVIPNEINK